MGVASIKFKSLSSIVKLIVGFEDFGYLILDCLCPYFFAFILKCLSFEDSDKYFMTEFLIHLSM